MAAETEWEDGARDRRADRAARAGADDSARAGADDSVRVGAQDAVRVGAGDAVVARLRPRRGREDLDPASEEAVFEEAAFERASFEADTGGRAAFDRGSFDSSGFDNSASGRGSSGRPAFDRAPVGGSPVDRGAHDTASFDDQPFAPRVWETVRASMDGRGARALGAAAAVVVLLTVVAVWWNRPSGTPVPPLPAVASARDGAQSTVPESTGSPAAVAEASGGAAPVGAAPGGAAAGGAVVGVGSEQAAATPSSVVVSVVGLVAQPGIVTLGAGARVADALTAAGGPAPNADTLGLNLARPLADGEQIVVGALSAESGPPESAVIGAGGAAPIAAPGAGGGAGSVGGAGGGAAGGAPGGGPLSLSAATPAELETLPGVGPVTAAAIVQWRTDNGPFASVEQLAEVPGIGPARLAKLQPLVVP